MTYIELTDALDKEIFKAEWINILKKNQRYDELVSEIRKTDRQEAFEIEKARVGEELAKKRIHVLFDCPIQ